jgi:ADP-ribose pyrophosphatase
VGKVQWSQLNYYQLIPDPGLSNSNMRTVACEIDLNDQRNKNPIPQLEEGEYIESFKVPLTDLASRLEALEKEGYALEAGLASIALGIELAKKYGLK